MNNQGRKEMGPKRVRRPKWSFEETKLLADCKKVAFLNGEEGGQVWKQIADNLSRRQAEKCQMRSNDECRRKWDTLKKVYNHIERYCVQTGQDHWQLDEDELKSMKLETAYRQDWYTIVREVSGHTQVPTPLKRRKASNSSPVPKCTPEDGVPTPGPLALLSSGDPPEQVMETPNVDHPKTTMDREHEAPMHEVVPAQQHQQNSMKNPQGQMNSNVLGASRGMATRSGGSSFTRYACALSPVLEILSDEVQPIFSFTSQPASLPNITPSNNVDRTLRTSSYSEYNVTVQEFASQASGSNSLMLKYVADNSEGRVVTHKDFPVSSQSGVVARKGDAGVGQEQGSSSVSSIQQIGSCEWINSPMLCLFQFSF